MKVKTRVEDTVVQWKFDVLYAAGIQGNTTASLEDAAQRCANLFDFGRQYEKPPKVILPAFHLAPAMQALFIREPGTEAQLVLYGMHQAEATVVCRDAANRWGIVPVEPSPQFKDGFGVSLSGNIAMFIEMDKVMSEMMGADLKKFYAAREYTAFLHSEKGLSHQVAMARAAEQYGVHPYGI